jgi:cystathionine beta-lyase/cystathionine gamma-synthase
VTGVAAENGRVRARVGRWCPEWALGYSRHDASEKRLARHREATLIGSATGIDLRSDTVTRPSTAMRAAMVSAPVGNDEYGEDPTINRLQERTAALLEKEAALWFPSGTMANQAVLRVLTRPGDDVVVSRESHAVWHETGGSAANVAEGRPAG